MTLPSFEDSGLIDDANVRKAYDLAKDVTEDLSDAHQGYLALTLAVAGTLRSLADADDAAKTRWSVIMLTSVAQEFAGIHADEVGPRAEALLTQAGADHGEYNFDDPATDLSAVPDDLKVIVAAGIVHSVDTVKAMQGLKSLADVQDRFNRHAAGIAPTDIPASLHRKMTDALAQINAFNPS